MINEDEIAQILENIDADSPYYCIGRVLPDGTFAYVGKLAYTYGLHLGCTRYNNIYRFCFQTLESAKQALMSIQSFDEVPDGDWVAARPADRLPQPCMLEDAKTPLTFDAARKQGIYTGKLVQSWYQDNHLCGEYDVGVGKFIERLNAG